MFGLQNLRDMRIVGLHPGASLQVVAVDGDPHRSHRDRDGDVLEDSPAEEQVARSIFEVGLDEPKEIECLSKVHPLADADHALLVALDIAREQERERYDPVEDEVQGDDDAPVTANAVEIPVDLLRQDAGPVDKELTEGEIDIEHDEG